MTTADKKTFEAALKTKRQELIRTIRGRAAELTLQTGETELIDQIQGMAGRDEAALMLSRFSATLEDVERSLRVMSSGDYGICAMCDEPIAIKRLQTIPWAEYCVRCQEEVEAGQNGWAGSHVFERRVA
jgi:DnaK suppressor protein